MSLIAQVLFMGSMKKNGTLHCLPTEYQGFIFTVLYLSTLKRVFIESSSSPSVVEMDEDDLT